VSCSQPTNATSVHCHCGQTTWHFDASTNFLKASWSTYIRFLGIPIVRGRMSCRACRLIQVWELFGDETAPRLYTKTHISYPFPMHPLSSLLIPSENTLDIIPRLFASFPTSKQCSRRFAPSLPIRAFATTFAYLRASSDFVPASSEILRLSYFFAALAHHPRSSSRSSHVPPP
jgi:hypothetical protein